VAKYFKIAILIFVSLVGLLYAFENIEFSELLHHLYAVDIFKFSLSIIILIFACFLRAKRLKYLAAPIDKNISTHHLFGATMIGYFGNGILFFRLGELLKAYAISQGKKLKPSESFGLIMLERLIDSLSVFFFLIITLPFLPLENQTIRFWIIGFVAITISFIGVLIILRFLNWGYLLNYLQFLKTSYKNKIVDLINKVFSGIELVFRTENKIKILVSTFLIWLCYFLMTKWLLESCNIQLSLVDSFIMLIMGAIIIAVPALPGGLGTYEAGITYTLTYLFFVSKDLALTYAIVSHTSNYLPYILIGSIYFIKSGLKISSVNSGRVQK
tara:strand:+ start:1120 stop:2103 length:984 start_codon:yes stop_codon:yes gene_type:complete